ncbi:hypothetical protein [Halosolutus gelatinilyticus]|uniref:hypothetical protein n=1 Tax=Halosolutus gelatinilyticus TaxID=2931975 RepID=UPI001FF1760C|nr:hypothetical protein [Halosolutus gelatinilyticus]
MSRSTDRSLEQTSDTSGRAPDRTSVYREYIKDVRVLEIESAEEDLRYRFEAPNHPGLTFETPEKATLYADVYFDTNGFREAGTGEIGIPPAIVQSGMDVIAAYMLAQPETSKDWVASFFGSTHEELDTYVSWVRTRAEEVRRAARDEGIE